MLKIGLTGGIAAGKSVVAKRLAELGAVLIDADLLARQVVEPGTPGLARVVEAFGPELLQADGSLDRAKLAAVVFADETRRQELNGIIHPLVRAEAARLMDNARQQEAERSAGGAGTGSVLVQDIPLLVESGQGAAFHLVLVVEAPLEQRVGRMLAHRAMTEEQALARIKVQASPEDRLAAADVVIDNARGMDQVLAQVDRLWRDRLEPFARNLAAGRAVRPAGPAVLVPPDPSWPAQAARLAARIQAAAGGSEDDTSRRAIVAVDHIGSTAVPGLEAKDVLDLQIRVRSLMAADSLAPALAAAGFPPLPGSWADTPKASDPDPAHWGKRLHGTSDPGRPANVHVRVDGSPGARYALAFRDWLRGDASAREAYLVQKRGMASLHAVDDGTAGYALGKEPWFTEVAEPAVEAWVRENGWKAPWETTASPGA